MRMSRTPLILLLASPLWLTACGQAVPPPEETAAPPPMRADAQPTPPQRPASPAETTKPSAAAADSDAQTDSTVVSATGEETSRSRIQRLLGDPEAYETLFRQLQEGVAADDRAAVSTLMRYPLRVEVDGTRREIADAEAFIAAYPSIMTPALKRVIAGQSFDTLFVNWQGVMVGQGQVWFSGQCLDKACKQTEVKVSTLQD